MIQLEKSSDVTKIRPLPLFLALTSDVVYCTAVHMQLCMHWLLNEGPLASVRGFWLSTNPKK